MVLVVIVNDQAFQRIAYGFPALVVLIEYVPAIHVAVFVDHQKHLLEMQAEIRVLHISRQKLPHRVCQPRRGHIPAVRQERIELHMYPARARDFNVPGRELELQPVAPPVSASARHLCFAEGAQIERRRLKEICGFFQRELQFLAAHFAAVRQRRQRLKGQCRSAQLALRRFPGHAYRAVLRQRGGHGGIVRRRQHWVLLRSPDMGRGGDDHRATAAQLFRQRIHEGGLAAAADEGGDAPFHAQQGGNVHHMSSGTRAQLTGAPFSKIT